jgi:transcriptional regulator with XRE-family HTH domain
MEYSCQDLITLIHDIPVTLGTPGVYMDIPGGYAQPVSLARNIRTLRRAADLTQTALGDQLGVGQGAVSKWETGETEPDASLLPTLAVTVRTTLDQLLKGVNLAYDNRDLPRHSSVERSAPHQEVAVDPASARLVVDLKARIAKYEVAFDQAQDVARRAAKLAIAARRAQGRPIARRKSGGRRSD